MSVSALFSAQHYFRFQDSAKSVSAGASSNEGSVSSRQNSDFINDSIHISPYNQVRQLISRFNSESILNSSTLNATLNVAPQEFQDSEGVLDTKLERDLDLMLRLISKDDEHYTQLKARFKKLFKDIADAGSADRRTVHEQMNVPGNENGNSDQNAISQERFFSLEIKFQKIVIREEIEIRIEELRIQQSDPIVLDLTGEGINLTEPGKGALFDITADGRLDSTAWVKGGTGLLAYDRNGNGSIDDGSELFGDQNGSNHGFAELAGYDENKDDKINNLDPIYKSLKVYRDQNEDGKISKNELSSLPELGIRSINLDFTRASDKINGNFMILKGSFEREDGSVGLMGDVLLGYRQV